MLRYACLCAGLAFAMLPNATYADSATVAVASNFAPTAEALAASYGKSAGHQITIASGSTGKLSAQIGAGAPFDAFLSADKATAERLGKGGLGLPDSEFTYATGQLVLWSSDPKTDLADPKAALGRARHVAIANPEVAPYGKAAAETLASLGLSADLGGRIVTAENIGQAQSLVASGAADLGFVAAASRTGKSDGASWLVPEALHHPIAQDAILLMRGKDNAAAKGFLDYLKTPDAKAAITAAGYAAAP